MAQQLAIPASTGADACTQGGLSEVNTLGLANFTSFPSLPTTNSATISIAGARLGKARTLKSAIRKNPGGALIGETTLSTTQSIPTLDRTFSDLEENTRYVFVIYENENDQVRLCFKTRGEFTPAEQNLFMSGGTWQPNLPQYNQTGCYAVASTRQDIRDCYCNGTRNGTHILAGQTAASQAQRAYLNCPDLDS